MKEEKNSLKLKHKIGYGLGDAGGVMTFALMSSVLHGCSGDQSGYDRCIAADMEHLGFHQRSADGCLHRQGICT